jgi:hypothetical protein
VADETPTLRLELGGGELNTALGWTHTYLYLGDSVDAEVDMMLPNDVIAALAAALDPATTATLFDQRDAAIERAEAAERELVDVITEVERMRPVLEAALAVVADRRLVVATGLAVTRQGQALVDAVEVYNQTSQSASSDHQSGSNDETEVK